MAEWLGKTLDIEGLVDHALSRRERERFTRLDPGDRREAFLQCWTQKEAYLKAIGAGLFVPPAMVEGCFGSGEPVGLKGIFGDARVAARLFVDLVVPRGGYIGAVAAEDGQWRTGVRAFDTSSLVRGA